MTVSHDSDETCIPTVDKATVTPELLRQEAQLAFIRSTCIFDRDRAERIRTIIAFAFDRMTEEQADQSLVFVAYLLNDRIHFRRLVELFGNAETDDQT
jgi:hypothetical protein